MCPSFSGGLSHSLICIFSLDFLLGPRFPEAFILWTSFYPFNNEMCNPDSSSAPLPLHPVLHFSPRFWLYHSHICPSLDEPFIVEFLAFVHYSHPCYNLLRCIPSKYTMSSLCPWNQEQTSCLDSHHQNLHMASSLR